MVFDGAAVRRVGKVTNLSRVPLSACVALDFLLFQFGQLIGFVSF